MNDRQRDMVDVLRAVQRAAKTCGLSYLASEIDREAAAINADATEIEAGKAENRWPVPLDENEAMTAMSLASMSRADTDYYFSGVRSANYLGWCRMVADAAAMTDKTIRAGWYTDFLAVDAFLRQVPPDYYARWGL